MTDKPDYAFIGLGHLAARLLAAGYAGFVHGRSRAVDV
jgi:3-hydroxyisobutyrate dehydrogenase-like beta-hydroxyacid dehydrogenase